MNRKSHDRFRYLPIVTLILLLNVVGCGSGASVSKSQFDRLQLGYSSSDVEEILGKGKDLDVAEVDRLLKESLPSLRRSRCSKDQD